MLAERQYGVVSRAPLSALGVGRGAVERRLASGRLLRLHRGVYAVGHSGAEEQGGGWRRSWRAATAPR